MLVRCNNKNIFPCQNQYFLSLSKYFGSNNFLVACSFQKNIQNIFNFTSNSWQNIPKSYNPKTLSHNSRTIFLICLIYSS